MKHKTADLIGDSLDAAVALADGRLVLADEPGWPKGEYKRQRAEWGGRHMVRWYGHEGEDADGPETEEIGGWEPIDNWGSPSTDPNIGMQFIERERIGTTWDDIQERWNAELEHAATPAGVQRSFAVGPTILIAAMRAYVAAKLGEEVDL